MGPPPPYEFLDTRLSIPVKIVNTPGKTLPPSLTISNPSIKSQSITKNSALALPKKIFQHPLKNPQPPHPKTRNSPGFPSPHQNYKLLENISSSPLEKHISPAKTTKKITPPEKSQSPKNLNPLGKKT